MNPDPLERAAIGVAVGILGPLALLAYISAPVWLQIGIPVVIVVVIIIRRFRQNRNRSRS